MAELALLNPGNARKNHDQAARLCSTLTIEIGEAGCAIEEIAEHLLGREE